MAAFNMISIPLLILPFVYNAMIDITTVNKRLSKFLNAPDRPVTIEEGGSGNGGSGGGGNRPVTFEGHYLYSTPAVQGGWAVEIQNASFRWPKVLDEKEKEEEEKKEKESASWGRTIANLLGRRARLHPSLIATRRQMRHRSH